MLTILGRGGFGVDRGFNKLTNTHVCGVWFVNSLQLLGWGVWRGGWHSGVAFRVQRDYFYFILFFFI